MYLRALTALAIAAKYEAGGLLPSNKKKVRIKADVRCQHIDEEVRICICNNPVGKKKFPFICLLAVKIDYVILTKTQKLGRIDRG